MCGLRTGKNSRKNRHEANNEKTNSAKNLEKFVGDGLTLRIESNEKSIEVNGDGCRLIVSSNRGKIRINGDGCRLRIERNDGDVEYRGDGGRISLGPHSTGTKVHYFGEGGKVNVATSPEIIRKKYSTTSAGKNDPTDPEDCDQRTDNVDDIITEKIPTRITRTTSKTVRIFYGNPKIISPKINKNCVSVSKVTG